MPKRQSPAQRRASLRNLKKARAARSGRVTRRRTGRVRRVKARRRAGKKVRGNPGHAPKIGAWTRKARTLDVMTAPAQGSLLSRGLNADGVKDIGKRYAGEFAGGETENVITTVKGIGTGLARNWITSKSGAYRGMGRKKILSYVQAFSSEIVATAKANPITQTGEWNANRHLAYQAYDSSKHIYAPGTEQFISSLTLQGAAWAAQKGIEMFGINKMLPKGVNL